MEKFKHNIKQREKHNTLALYPAPTLENYQLVAHHISFIAPDLPCSLGSFEANLRHHIILFIHI